MAVKKSLPQESKVRRTGREKTRKLPPGVVERNGRWYVRVRYREGDKRHAAWRECAKNPTDAKEKRKQLKAELERHGPASLQNAQQTFEALADYYRDNYLIEAKYVDGKKIAGRRNTRNPRYQLEQLRAAV